jgi:hypothetical protein
MLLGFVVGLVLVNSGTAEADFTFGEPTNFAPLGDIWGALISPDRLSVYFGDIRASGYGSYDIWVVTRETTDDGWGTPVNLGPLVNTAYCEYPNSISADGLSLYICEYNENRPGGYGSSDIWVATRETTNDDWGTVVNLGPTINSAYTDLGCFVSTDGLSLYFQSNRPGGVGAHDIWVATRETTDDDWAEPVNLGSTVNSSSWDSPDAISTDGLVFFFESNREGYGRWDIWMVTRPTTSDPWGCPVNVGPAINTSAYDWWASISCDGSTLYFLRSGSSVLQAPIIPIVDLNGDGIVDCADMCIMVDHWGKNYSLCDIGPTPLGDGIVDVQDLIVLAEHLFEDYRLIAHWKLDETEEIIAYESTGNKDATCHGEPIWQPDGGKVCGALQFDGIDDYVSTPFVLNPGEVSFSATAWIRGGAPGQVIISQADAEEQSAIESGSTWLGINPSNGGLMTGLMDIFFGPLESESVVTDEQWHHVGLVYDFNTMKRHLYVDGVEVAVDAGFVGGVQSTAGLYIGASKDLDITSFFSGLIDDICIYNQALTAEEIAALAR